MCSTDTGRGRKLASVVGSDGMHAPISVDLSTLDVSSDDTDGGRCCQPFGWRRERDLNPRGGSTPPTRLAGEHFRPLSHPSEWDRSIRNACPGPCGRDDGPRGPSNGAVPQVAADVAHDDHPSLRVEVAVDAQEL